MTPTPSQTVTEHLKRYESLQYGMFIHYGMSTFSGVEIPKEATPLETYIAGVANPDQWVRVAKAAGMKYAVLTTKHCHGHCLWPSKLTDYCVVGDENDLVAQFVSACREHDILPAFYYLLGWDCYHQPKMDPDAYRKFCLGQLEELLTSYGPILELWLDIPWDMGESTQSILCEIYSHVKNLQPDCLVMFSQSINVMHGIEDPFALCGATYFYEPTPSKVRMWPSDITNGERRVKKERTNSWMVIDSQEYYVPLEVCDTIGLNWFWEPNDPPRDLNTLSDLLVNSIGSGANLLLDVPPDKSGSIPEEAVSRLLEMRASSAAQGLFR